MTEVSKEILELAEKMGNSLKKGDFTAAMIARGILDNMRLAVEDMVIRKRPEDARIRAVVPMIILYHALISAYPEAVEMLNKDYAEALGLEGEAGEETLRNLRVQHDREVAGK